MIPAAAGMLALISAASADQLAIVPDLNRAILQCLALYLERM